MDIFWFGVLFGVICGIFLLSICINAKIHSDGISTNNDRHNIDMSKQQELAEDIVICSMLGLF